MNISDEHDLMGRLDQALQAITPRPAPVGQAARRGTVIRVRRRLAAVAGLAVVAAGVAVPVMLHQQAAQPALSKPRHHHVTVYPAGPHAPAGLIASGAVDGRPWRMSTSKPGTDGAARGSQCFTVLSTQGCGPVGGAGRADPVNFTGISAAATRVEYGPVSAAVRHVTVQLADGTVLTLHPVSVYGIRYVAFAVPLHAVISRITAYAAHGELASAIPFNAPAWGATVGQWLRPGQRGLPRASHLVASGTAGGGAWSVTAYVGPWGECVVARGGGTVASSCAQVSSPQGASVLGWTAGPPRVVSATASAAVDHVVISLAGGGTIRVRAIAVGEQKFFGFALGRGQRASGWRAYDEARTEVASGSLAGP